MRNCAFILAVLLLACSSSVPKDVLPPARMQTILWDMLRADELADYYIGTDSAINRLEKHTGYYQDILTIHNITKEKFKKSMQYYQNHPVLFKEVLDSLQSIADRQQKKADSSIWSRNAGVDSIQKTPRFIDSLKKNRPGLPTNINNKKPGGR